MDLPIRIERLSAKELVSINSKEIKKISLIYLLDKRGNLYHESLAVQRISLKKEITAGGWVACPPSCMW